MKPALVTLFLMLTSIPAAAQEVILTLTGAVRGGRVEITRDDLAAMGWREMTTSTSVSDGPQVFGGVLMRELLGFAGAAGDQVTATALNDYVIDIPISDFHDYDVLAALTVNGAAMTRRDKGPVWIVYPRDDHPELADIRYDMRWVWQLTALHVQ